MHAPTHLPPPLFPAAFVVLYTAAGPPLPVPADADEAEQPLVAQHHPSAPGAAVLTGPQAAVRVAFFLWVSLLNLVAVSSLVSFNYRAGVLLGKGTVLQGLQAASSVG